MTDPIDLDHVALASQYAWDNLDRYRADLGGEWLGGGIDPGYYWWQVRFANGMRIELLEPIPDHPIDFLRRFLAHSGPGPHHLTFMENGPEGEYLTDTRSSTSISRTSGGRRHSSTPSRPMAS